MEPTSLLSCVCVAKISGMVCPLHVPCISSEFLTSSRVALFQRASPMKSSPKRKLLYVPSKVVPAFLASRAN